MTQSVVDQFDDGEIDLGARADLRADIKRYLLAEPRQESKRQLSAYNNLLKLANNSELTAEQQDYTRQVLCANSYAPDYDTEDDEDGSALLRGLAGRAHAQLTAALGAIETATTDAARCAARDKALTASAQVLGDWDPATQQLRLQHIAALLDSQQYPKAQKLAQYHIQGDGLLTFPAAEQYTQKIANATLTLFRMALDETDQQIFDSCAKALEPYADAAQRRDIRAHLKMAVAGPQDLGASAGTGAVAAAGAAPNEFERWQALIDSIGLGSDGKFWQEYKAAGQEHLNDARQGCKDDRNHHKRWLGKFERYIESGRVPAPVVDAPSLQTNLRAAFKDIVGHQKAKEALTDQIISLDSSKGTKVFSIEGPPGNGKSELVKACARASQIPIVEANGFSLTPESLCGRDPGKISGQPSALARTMIAKQTRRLVYFIDEIEKVPKDNNVENLLAPLMGSDELFFDTYFGFPIDISRVILMGTMNDGGAAAEHIQSRMKSTRFKTDRLTKTDVKKIAAIKFRQLEEKISAAYGERPVARVQPDCVVALLARVEKAFTALNKPNLSYDCRPMTGYVDTLQRWLLKEHALGRTTANITAGHLDEALRDTPDVEVYRGNTWREWKLRCSDNDVERKIANDSLTWPFKFAGTEAKLHLGPEGVEITWTGGAHARFSPEIVSFSHVDAGAARPSRTTINLSWGTPSGELSPDASFFWPWAGKREALEAILLHHENNADMALEIRLTIAGG